MYQDIMVDIETFGTDADAVVVSIGAVKFNLDGQDTVDSLDNAERVGIWYLEPEAQLKNARTVNGQTLLWWLQQSDSARQFIYTMRPTPITEALEAIATFCKDSKHLWGNGATFDNTIIRSLFSTFNVKFPISYRGDRCHRTLINLLPREQKPQFLRYGVQHNALDDAISQVLYAQEIYGMLRGGF